MDWGLTFLLVLARIGAVVSVAPLLGNRAVGPIPRLGIAVACSILAIPLVSPPELTFQWVPMIDAIFAELMIGLLMGMGVAILFSATSMAGTLVGQLAGLQMPLGVDPATGEASSPVGNFFSILALAVFALIGGPELVLGGVLDTLINVPLGTSLLANDSIVLLISLLQQSFVLLLRAVAPAVASLLIANILIGMIGRSYPQLNMLQFGLSSNLVIMFLAIFLTLGGSMWLFVDDMEAVVDVIRDTLTTAVDEADQPLVVGN